MKIQNKKTGEVTSIEDVLEYHLKENLFVNKKAIFSDEGIEKFRPFISHRAVICGNEIIGKFYNFWLKEEYNII